MSETKMQSRTTNGVDVIALAQTIRAIEKDSDLAQFRFRAENQWLAGGYNRSTIRGFYGVRQENTPERHFVLEADEPPVLLGRDLGPNPVEHLLNALAACLTTTLVYHAAARGIEIESVESSLEGDIDLRGFLGLDPTVRRGFQNIRVKFRLKSEADTAKLLELAKFSPVFDTISNPVNVQLSIEKV